MRFVTMGVGAQNSPRYAPAGLLAARRRIRIAIDGGLTAVPQGRISAWLVTDESAELIRDIRNQARDRGVEPHTGSFQRNGLRVERHPVVHTNHPTYGYTIEADGRRAVWAPEFIEFPTWAAGADLMFAEAAGWNRPILFRGGVGGHLDALTVAREAKALKVRRLVFAHIGRPTIRALDAGETPGFGEFARDGQIFLLQGSRSRRPR